MKEPKHVKLTPITVDQKEIDAINKRLTLMRKRLREDILFVGGKLFKIRERLPHGQWGPFIEANFPMTIKTANIWIRAYEGRESELAVTDWDDYMRQLYGNTQKLKLKAPKDPEDKQSGGEKFEPGFEHEEDIFQDKGKPGMVQFKKLVGLLEERFLSSPSITSQAKLEFINELIAWLEDRKALLESGGGESR